MFIFCEHCLFKKSSYFRKNIVVPKKEYKVNTPKPGSHKFNLVGERFGMLLVKNYHALDKYKNKLWLCNCDCGKSATYTTAALRQGKATSCKCNQYKKGSDVYNYTGYKDISGSKWYSIKQNAKTRKLDFEILKEDVWEIYIAQHKKCSFTNLPVSFKTGTASVDRKDNALGYTVENIHIVHKDINLMRNKFSIVYFKRLCKLVSTNQNK